MRYDAYVSYRPAVVSHTKEIQEKRCSKSLYATTHSRSNAAIRLPLSVPLPPLRILPKSADGLPKGKRPTWNDSRRTSVLGDVSTHGSTSMAVAHARTTLSIWTSGPISTSSSPTP